MSPLPSVSRLARVAVIPTRDRPTKYRRAVAALDAQVDLVVTVAHEPGTGEGGSDYALHDGKRYLTIPFYGEKPNISEMWALGMDAAAAALAGATDARSQPPVGTPIPQHWVALVNDDAEVSQSWFHELVTAADRNGHVLAGGQRSPYGNGREHMAGYAFIVKSGTIRPNPRWSWWVSDDHFEHEAIERFGGFTIVRDAKVRHSHEDLPAELADLAKQSRADVRAWQRGER